MRRWLCWVGVILLSGLLLAPAAAATAIQIVVDNRQMAFQAEPPYVDPRSKRIMVPLREMATALGAELKWDKSTSEAILRLNGQSIRLAAGQPSALVNGSAVALEVPAQLRHQRMMVPLRWISEVLQAQVAWDEARQRAEVATMMPKATWIWDSRLIESESGRDEILQFAHDHHVNAIYLQINRDVSPDAYGAFIRSAARADIRVEALAGRPEWALATSRESVRPILAWVRQYQMSVPPEERFAGWHLDMEPYLLREWTTNRQPVLEEWINTVQWLGEEMNGSGLGIVFDIPYWLHQVKAPGTEASMSAWLLEQSDGVVIMNYRNHARGNNGIIDNAGAILDEAYAQGKQVLIAVETAPNAESERTSFYVKGVRLMEQELRTAHSELTGHAAYGGMAIHDYRSWAALEQRAE